MTALNNRAAYNRPNPNLRLGSKPKQVTPKNGLSAGQRSQINVAIQTLNEAKTASLPSTTDYKVMEAFKILRNLCRELQGLN